MFSLSFFNFKCVCYEEKPENSIVNYLKEVFNIPDSPVSGPPALPVTEMTRSEPKVEPEVPVEPKVEPEVPVEPKVEPEAPVEPKVEPEAPVVVVQVVNPTEYKKFENPEEKVLEPEMDEFVIISTEIGNVTMSPFIYNSNYM